MADHIPTKVVSNILSNLPTKKVMQCTVVCKSWYSLIKTPTFIQTHLEKNLTTTSNQKYDEKDMKVYFIRHGLKKTLCFFDEKSLLQEHGSLEIDESNPRHYATGEISCSCNGLVCFTLHSVWNSVNDYKVILWNPFIRKSFTLPDANSVSTLRSGLRGPAITLGIGFESLKNDYKVLRVARFLDKHKRTRFEFDLYSLNKNSWRDITQVIGFNSDEIVPMGPLSYAEDCFHCFAYLPKENRIRLKILMVKAGGESFKMASLPQKERFGIRTSAEGLTIKEFRPLATIVVVERCLDRIEKTCYFNVWVMSAYGFEDSWCLFFKFRFRDIFPQFLGFSLKDEAICEYQKSIFSHDPVLKKTKVFKAALPGRYSLVESYIPCLALLDRGK